jgi:hypothetical protein
MVKPPPKRPEGGKHAPEDRPYLPGDPIPVPEAVEKDTETTWQLFSELAAKDDKRYAETVQVTMPGSIQSLPRKAIQPAPASGKPTLEKLLALCTQTNRVCPVGPVWQELYDAMVAKAPAGAAASLAPPLTGVEWTRTSPLAKRMTFKDQLGWAAKHGLVDDVHRFLVRLTETQWHHMGD